MRATFGWSILSVFIVTAMFSASGCGPKYPNCDDDKHCAEQNQYCVDKLCRECKTDGNCVSKTGDKCQMCSGSYTCMTKPGCCHTDADCPGGKCWKDEGAEIGTCGGECKDNSHCPADYECKGERCVKIVYGCEKEGCPAGKKCVNGGCIWACNFQNVYFDFNESRLTTDARRILGTNAECAKTIGVPVSVEGHCDERGTEEYNLQLGMRRAGSAKKFMVDKGAASGNLSTMSYGEDKPVCSQSGEDCWWKNRRVETIVK
jgi:peptidoglycan-associated lipoprotein